MTPHGDRHNDGRNASLHICPVCTCELVQPLDWTPAQDDEWTLHRRCPSCEWQHRGIYGDACVAAYATVLDRGDAALKALLARWERASIADAVEAFVAALAADGILPADF
jgi:hypothetical protein